VPCDDFGFIQETEKKDGHGTKLHVRNGQIGAETYYAKPVTQYSSSVASVVAKMEKTFRLDNIKDSKGQ